MVLFVIGLGLASEKDITLRGLEAIQSSELVFLESYTSILVSSHSRLEDLYGKCVVEADRMMVESNAEQIYLPAISNNVSFLVVGDPVCATTHSDLILRARSAGVEVQIIHNASIMGAVGSCGLSLYNFGQTVSIPLFEDNWRPTSFWDKICYNRGGGMHTLCLLDIKVKEPDFDALKRGKLNVFLPPRFMTISQAISQLLEILTTINATSQQQQQPNETTLCIGMARVGHETQQIVAGTMRELQQVDFGEPLHSLIICGGQVHELELEMLQQYVIKDSRYQLSPALHPDHSL